MSQHHRIFWLFGIVFGILGGLVFIWWWRSGAEASEGVAEQISEQVVVSNSPDPTVTLRVDQTQIITTSIDFSPTLGSELPPSPTNFSPTHIVVSVTTATPTQLPTPTLTAPTQVISPTPIPTPTSAVDIHQIPFADLTTTGLVTLARSAVGTTVATFGTPTASSYLFANQLSFLLPPLSPLTTFNWLNIRLRLTSSEVNPVFDDPALVILVDDKPLFAVSAADWQTILSTLDDNWWSLSLYIPPIWGGTKVTVLGGDNGDLQFPTVVDLELVGMSEQPLYPFTTDQIATTIPSQLYWQPVAGSVLLTPDSNPHTSPYYLAANIDSLDSTLPSFYQTEQLLWLSSNLLHDGAMLISDHSYFHTITHPDDPLDSPTPSLPLSIWPLNAIYTIPLLPTD